MKRKDSGRQESKGLYVSSFKKKNEYFFSPRQRKTSRRLVVKRFLKGGMFYLFLYIAVRKERDREEVQVYIHLIIPEERVNG